MYKVAIHYNEKYGFAKYNPETRELLVTHPNPRVREKVYKYLTTTRSITQPADPKHGGIQLVRITPTDSVEDIDISLCEMFYNIGLHVDWGYENNTKVVDEFIPRVVNISDRRLRGVLNNNKCIREFGDRYEYCLVKNYENLYHEPVIDSIQFDDVFVQLLTDKNTRVIVSIDFQKDMFKIVDILDWINKNSVKVLSDNDDKIENAWNMIEGLKFKGLPIVLYRKGFETIHININSLREVTDEFIPGIQKINTMNSKEIDSLDNKGEIFLNGRKIDYIPEIWIDLTKDLLISNGHIFVASYLGDYGGCIGLFEEEGDDLPLAWIHDTETKVYIDIYENDNRKVIFVEHSYAIDIDSLLNI